MKPEKPSHADSILDPKALRRLSNLELVARRIVEGTLSGQHHSPIRGFSTDFLQHRPYVIGDDVRHLDWKVFGKTDRHFVRQFEDDTHLRATLVLDASGSMAYQSDGVSKLHYAIRLAAGLAFLLTAQQDSIGLEVFDTQSRLRLPAKNGHRQLQQILTELSNTEARGETSLSRTLDQILPRLPRRGMLILLTDGFDEPESMIDALGQLGQRDQEVLLFQVLDRQELEFQFNQWGKFQDLEEVEEEILVDPAQVRNEYLERMQNLLSSIRTACTDNQIDYTEVITDRPYDDVLAEYLSRRRAGA